MSDRDDLVKVVLANDGGTCHGFGKMHCFNDPAAKWEGRRCNECKDWAERFLRNIEEPIRADEREYLARMEGWMTPKAHMDVVLDYSKRLAKGESRVVLADLRAKVEALYGTGAYEEAIADVLALIDGSSDG